MPAERRSERLTLEEARERQMVGSKCGEIIRHAPISRDSLVSINGDVLTISTMFAFRSTIAEHRAKIKGLANEMGLRCEVIDREEMKIYLSEGVGKIQEIDYITSKEQA